MDIESDDGMEMGRLVCEIRADKVPKTAENFRQLCTHERGFGYRESVLFRILPNFGIQGGDITEDSGMGGRSVYGRYFEDESFELKHEYGSVTMANSGPNTNNSQFLIVTNENGASWLDEKHVVFGKVIEGEDVLKRIELYGTETGLPSKRIIVVDSGELEENEAERILRTCELKK
jgi:cyclophilin family peptidyl-prolyl cis-trans isomerase